MLKYSTPQLPQLSHQHHHHSTATAKMPATLYTFGASVWGAAAELAVHELGVPDVEFKQTNLLQGENFEPAFIAKNPNATLPTLEADGKTFTNTTDVVHYLASIAPTPLPEPTAEQKELIRIIHEDQYDPNFALLLVVSPFSYIHPSPF